MLEVLVVDDDDTIRGCVSDALAAAGHRTVQARDGEGALAALAQGAFDLVVADVQMPKMNGLTLLRRLRTEAPGTAVVIMTSFARIEDVVGSLRDGAVDYVTKPFDAEDFARDVIGPIDERRSIRKKFEAARSAFVGREAGAQLVGTSLPMRNLRERIALVASTDAAVIVSGQRGTGKRLVARTLHAQSARREGPLVVIPCASLYDVMHDAEVRELSEFRPRNRRDEWFRSAEGGTLLLDRIEDLEPRAQRTLLRVIDEPMAQARRSRAWQPMGVRIVATTEKTPAELLASGFAEPLYFRLRTMDLSVPTLAERDGDLYLLACHFLRELTPPGRTPPSLSPRAWKRLTTCTFRQNVAGMERTISRALALAGGGEIDEPHLPDDLPEGP